MRKLYLAAVSLLWLAACGAPGTESNDVETAEQPVIEAQHDNGHDSFCENGSQQDLQWVDDMFATFDAGNLHGWASSLATDVDFKLANNPNVHGRGNVEATFNSLLPLFKSVHHDLLAVWKHGDGVTVKGNLVVVRVSDGATVTIPFVDVLTTKHHSVSQYLIYMDPTPLFQ